MSSSSITPHSSILYTAAKWYASLLTLRAGDALTADRVREILSRLTNQPSHQPSSIPPSLSIKILLFAVQLFLAMSKLKAISSIPRAYPPKFVKSWPAFYPVHALVFQGVISGATDVISFRLLQYANGGVEQSETSKKFEAKLNTLADSIFLVPMPRLIRPAQLFGAVCSFTRLTMSVYDFNPQKSDQFLEKITQCWGRLRDARDHLIQLKHLY